MPDDPNISRRQLLRGRFLGGVLSRVGEAVSDRLGPLGGDPSHAEPGQARTAGGDHQPFPILRPPGAIEEQAFLDGCTRCDACVEACPHDAIVHAPIRFRGAAGTPMIDPAHQPCWMCDDTPCITACEPNVLRDDVPIDMGVARVDTQLCLAHQNSFCTVCSEQCPVEGAITVQAGKPTINEETCTGCGVCQYVCPAPSNAILLMPAADRPGVAANNAGADEAHEGTQSPASTQRRPAPGEKGQSVMDHQPGQPGHDLPPMSDDLLDDEALAALFRDVRMFTQLDEIIVKQGPGYADDTQELTLDDAERMINERSVRGVQLRYRFRGSHWWDTLMPVDSGVRIVRVRHDFE